MRGILHGADESSAYYHLRILLGIGMECEDTKEEKSFTSCAAQRCNQGSLNLCITIEWSPRRFGRNFVHKL